jgi:hypothetical protein
VTDLSPILVPILVSVVLSVSGAFVVARYAGPAQGAYVAAIQGRMQVLEDERDDAVERIPRLEARIVALEERVHDLTNELRDRDQEIARLYRRLDADEQRLPK